MKLNYKEGTWFAVPLDGGGFASGVVARATTEGGIILCYFFGPKRNSVPTLTEVEKLNASGAIRAWIISDLALCQNEWPIIGWSEQWKRSEWPMPAFIRREPIGSKAWRVYYSDTDPSSLVREEPAPYDSNLEPDSTRGAKSVEIRLTKLLSGESENATQLQFRTLAASQVNILSDAPIAGGHFRVEVLQQLNTHGSNTTKPHGFDFYLYFPSEAAAQIAAKKTGGLEGFRTEVALSAKGDQWLCRASTSMIPQTAPLDQLATFFERLAIELDGTFDGWESNLVKF